MMSRKSIANAVGGKTARACDSCVRKRARWYCAADDAFLCQSCDSAVHSANPLARRHQRLRLNSATNNSKTPNYSPSWVSGFTRKPRTPRPRPKSEDLLSVVPESDDATSSSQEEEDQVSLYRVPNLEQGNELDVDLSDFAADVESLLGRNLESECFDMEGLGLVKVEEDYCRVGQQFKGDVDLMMMGEAFQLNFEEYEDDQEMKMPAVVVEVKNEREEQDESQSNKKNRKVLSLRLDCEAVIAAWGNLKSPWTNGERPDFDPHQPNWPNSMAVCGVSYGHTCGEYGVSTAAMEDSGREARVSRYREKRRTRLFSKKIRYEVRKLNAEKRPRMKGRFVKRTPFAQPTLPIISIN